MDHIEYLFAGFAVFWAGLFIYLLLLQTKVRSLLREIERLEERLAEHESGSPAGAPHAEP
jgi:CcmD family protein